MTKDKAVEKGMKYLRECDDGFGNNKFEIIKALQITAKAEEEEIELERKRTNKKMEEKWILADNIDKLNIQIKQLQKENEELKKRIKDSEWKDI